MSSRVRFVASCSRDDAGTSCRACVASSGSVVGGSVGGFYCGTGDVGDVDLGVLPGAWRRRLIGLLSEPMQQHESSAANSSSDVRQRLQHTGQCEHCRWGVRYIEGDAFLRQTEFVPCGHNAPRPHRLKFFGLETNEAHVGYPALMDSFYAAPPQAISAFEMFRTAPAQAAWARIRRPPRPT